jgi:di/tricarboxylate transporter
VLVVSVVAVGTGISSSGLLYRLGLWTVAHTRGGFLGQVLALNVAGVLTGPAMPNALGRMTLIAPALTDMVEALGYAPKSRGAAGLAMAAFAGFGQMTATFLTSSTTALLIVAVLPADISNDLDWVSWMVRAAPANACLFLGLIVSIVWLYRPRTSEEKAVRGRSGLLEVQRALLGPLSRNERLSFIVGLALLLGFVTQPLHGMHPAWVSVLALTALSLTGAVTTATQRMLNWNFVLLFRTLASLSTVLAHTQIARWFGHLVVDTVGVLTGTPVVFVAALTMLCFAVSFVLRWPAAASLLTIALAPVAGAAGINPLIVGLVTLIACNTFFLPYQSSVYLALYHGTGGALFQHAQARPAAFAYALITLIALCASVPAWHAMGLL